MNSGSWYWPDVSAVNGAKGATRYRTWYAIVVTPIMAILPVQILERGQESKQLALDRLRVRSRFRLSLGSAPLAEVRPLQSQSTQLESGCSSPAEPPADDYRREPASHAPFARERNARMVAPTIQRLVPLYGKLPILLFSLQPLSSGHTCETCGRAEAADAPTRDAAGEF
jgi:hypothetical protein